MTDLVTSIEDRRTLQEHIRRSLVRLTALRAASAASPARAAQRTALRAWQSERLAATHADLLRDPRYGAAAQFFLSDLYGPADTGARDEQMARAVPKLVPFLPIGALQALALAVELDALTEDLDGRLIDALAQSAYDPAPVALDIQTYAAAYRASNRRDERQRQVALVDSIGALLDRVSHRPMVSLALELSRQPARLAGLAAVQDFLERGLAAFRQLQDAQAFLRIIRERESAIMERLLAGESAPFDLAPTA
jgi:hypothetical protein